MKTLTRQGAGEQGAARPGWLLALAGVVFLVVVASLAGQRIGDALSWAKQNWLSTTALSTAAAVAAVLAPFLIRWLDRRRPAQAVQATHDSRQRLVMLQRVRYKWITGVLEPSLAHAAQLALGLERRPDTLDLGTRVFHRPDGPPQPLAAGIRISQVFDQVGGGLLILGAPGAGKTTLLLELVRELLDRAEKNPGEPIPVVLNLASWGRERKALAAWLVDELADGYKVPRRIASAWVAQDALGLLLDGLDEVVDARRAGCVEAINAYRDEHGLVPMVVCSRTAELQALGGKLRLEEAVELQPPGDAQVDDYLDRLEATGAPLGDVRAAMRTDPTLRELLRSPLLLHVVAIAHRGEPAPALQAPGTLVQRQTWLWEAYVARMFRQRPLDPSYGYTSQQALGWLAWLASALRDHDQSEFQLDRLTPNWLPTRARQRRLHRLSGLAVGLGISLLLVLAATALFAWSDSDPTSQALMEAQVGLTRLVITTLAPLAAGLTLVMSSLGLASRLTGSIRPAEELHWSWSGLGRRLPGRVVWGLAWGLVLGLLLGLVMALAFLLPNMSRVIALNLPGGIQVRGLAMLPAEMLTTGVNFGLLFGLLFAVTAGLTTQLRDERTLPNEGIRRSARHALTIGLAVTLIIGLAFPPALGGRANGLATGLIVGLAVGLVFGGAACLQHYRVRASLVRARVAPWRYGRFLEAMTERVLLRRTGSGYLFVHRLLRDYLADLAADQPPAAIRAAPASH